MGGEKLPPTTRTHHDSTGEVLTRFPVRPKDYDSLFIWLVLESTDRYASTLCKDG